MGSDNHNYLFLKFTHLLLDWFHSPSGTNAHNHGTTLIEHTGVKTFVTVDLQQVTIKESGLYLQWTALSFHLLLLALLFLALFQEGRCAELLFLFLGLALWSLRLPRLLGCDGDLHRFLVAQAQLGYLQAQILLQLCQVILPVGNSVCQQTQRWGNEWGNSVLRLRHVPNETPSERQPTPANG